MIVAEAPDGLMTFGTDSGEWEHDFALTYRRIG
jgi:hypothetical protein